MMLDQVRLEVSAKLDQSRRLELGRFMTPSNVARFMANLFPVGTLENVRLLDAGAGIGSLASGFLNRWVAHYLVQCAPLIAPYGISPIKKLGFNL